MGTLSDDRSLWRLGNVIDRHAANAPESTALVIGAERRLIKYAALAQLVVDHCNALLGRGLRSGDVVALQASNNIEFVVALLGAARANLIVAPLDPALPSTERRARVNRVGARVILTDVTRQKAGARENARNGVCSALHPAGRDRRPSCTWSKVVRRARIMRRYPA